MNKSLRRQLYFLKTLVSPKRAAAPSNETIDVVIPVIEKDLAILPLCLEGVRSCVTNPVGTIYIVAPSTPAIREFAVAHQCTFVDENEVFGWGVGAIQYRVNGANRAGWIFQQLLKLAGTIAQTEHFLVIDADHILIHPQIGRAHV